MKQRILIVAALSLAITGGSSAVAPMAAAQSAQDLIRSLEAPKMRSFQAPSEKENRVRALLDKMQTREFRQITIEERKEVAEYVEETKLPSIDMEVFFEYDSAAITSQSKPKLDTLGKALSDTKLKGQKFMIAGHTDAKGSDAYNLTLSQKRAQSVKAFLIEHYKLEDKKLVVIGFGEEQLKIKDKPEDGQNRRVQVVNLAVK